MIPKVESTWLENCVLHFVVGMRGMMSVLQAAVDEDELELSLFSPCPVCHTRCVPAQCESPLAMGHCSVRDKVHTWPDSGRQSRLRLWFGMSLDGDDDVPFLPSHCCASGAPLFGLRCMKRGRCMGVLHHRYGTLKHQNVCSSTHHAACAGMQLAVQQPWRLSRQFVHARLHVRIQQRHHNMTRMVFL